MMFSEAGATQEIIALVAAGCAFVYVLWKVFGFGPKKKTAKTGVVVSGRLQRGLDRASTDRTDRVG